MSENTFIERRQCIRIPIDTEITFTINSDNSHIYQGTSQNLCTNGIYLTTDYMAKLDDRIELTLITHEEDLAPLIAKGKVIRCKFDKKRAELFHISVEFDETHENWIQTFTKAIN